MNKTGLAGAILRAVYRYLLFFLLTAFVTTCCMELFVSLLTKSIDIILTPENMNMAAKLTFGNVLLLSFLFTVIDAVRRKYAVQRPMKQIMECAEKIMQGDFSVQIPYSSRIVADSTFDEIIDSFNKMTRELGSLETMRTDFITNVSHEMKTPLAIMQNYGILLQAPALPEEQRIEYAKGVSDAAHRMADMVTNILRLNRLENQQIYPQTSKFDLGEQLCECLLQYENVWEKSEIEVETDIEENITVEADSELLSLAWNNLFSNAFKFTPSGGMVSVSMTADEAYAVIRVKDTGCGMTAEIGSQIFEKFYQGDTSHAMQGNGLGLALVKRVIDILKGEISVESVVGQGTTFTVRIRRLWGEA